MIYPWGLGIQNAKVDAISKVRRPIDVSRLRPFFGLANYYQRFVKGFSWIVKPLSSWPRLMKSSFGRMHKNKHFRNWKLNLILHPFWGDLLGVVFSSCTQIGVFWDLEQSSHNLMRKIKSLWWLMQARPTTKQGTNIVHVGDFFGNCVGHGHIPMLFVW
jgi:hypothetical protein